MQQPETTFVSNPGTETPEATLALSRELLARSRLTLDALTRRLAASQEAQALREEPTTVE